MCLVYLLICNKLKAPWRFSTAEMLPPTMYYGEVERMRELFFRSVVCIFLRASAPYSFSITLTSMKIFKVKPVTSAP